MRRCASPHGEDGNMKSARAATGKNRSSGLAIDLDEIAATRRSLREARHLPGYFYSAPEILAAEREQFFMRDWLAVGRVEELPNPGDYRTFEIVGEPVLLVRNAAGALKALANVCRHRGVAVAEGSGNAKRFTCPYHAWTYDLDGRLLGASKAAGLAHADIAGCRLPELRCDTWGGFVFISFAADGPTLAEYLDADGYRASVAYVRPEDMVVVDTYTYEVDANWKLVPENLADVYHVDVIHRSTFGLTGYRPDQATAELTLTKYGWHKEYVSGTMAPDAELLFGPAPWLAAHEKGKLFAFSAFLRPNFYLFARADMVQPWVAYPLTPTRSQVIGWTCLPKEFLGQPAFKEKVTILKAFARRFAEEDFSLMRAMQRGFASRNFVRGPFHELETMIHHRINRYLDALLGDGELR
ncbi:MAG: aromatic ring-hydroxylating dioxygenase subunit alpha [Alphaproteobacteria bacterium]|nr:aromatic ring-hydroxylating dioxygenase subunit alpha [Alphaproteobacteria bacterium]